MALIDNMLGLLFNDLNQMNYVLKILNYLSVLIDMMLK